jgi:hypothetical protein
MTLNPSVRQDILTSWERCVVAGLRPDRFQVPYHRISTLTACCAGPRPRSWTR